MNQRGKKSATALAVVHPVPTDRLAPVAGMTQAQRNVWLETVNARPADWFGREHLPMLESYCRHSVYAKVLGAELDRMKPEWLTDEDGLRRHDRLLGMHDRETRALSSLATRLRLTLQALTDKRVAGRASDNFSADRKPWEDPED